MKAVEAQFNASDASTDRARKVLREGAPELTAVVQSGRVSVSAAADVAELPKETQREIVAKGEKEILEAAKQIRAKKAESRREELIGRAISRRQLLSARRARNRSNVACRSA